MVKFSLLFASILILCKVNHAEYWGGFQYYKYAEWPGLDGKGYDERESVILDLFHPHIPDSLAILHRTSVDSAWRVTSASNFLRSKINIHYGTRESTPINTLDLEHIDGAFFRCHIETHTIFVQFIFHTSNWDIKQRISGGDPLPITDHGHTDAAKYGDVDTWWQVMHNKGPEPFYINQGIDAKCNLNALNVLLQGPEITDEEMGAVQEKHGWSSITFADVGASPVRFLTFSASTLLGGVYNGKVFPVLEEKRHIRPKYKFRKGKKIGIYDRKYISEGEGFEEELIGHLVMKLENGHLFIYNEVASTLRRLDGSGELVLPSGMREVYVEKGKYRFVTVSEMWGHEYRKPGSFYGETVYKLVDENADQYVKLLTGAIYYYDNRDPDQIWYRIGKATYLYDSYPPGPDARRVDFNPDYHKSIHFPVTNPAHQRVLRMTDTPIYQNEENLPYNLLGFYLVRPGHAFSYRKVGTGWYNLDSAFAMMGCTIDREAKTWMEMRGFIIEQLSYGTVEEVYQVTLMVRSPDFVPAAPAPVAARMGISSRLLSYLPETKYKPNTNMIDLYNMINILEKEEETDLKLFVVTFMIIGLISVAIVWTCCFMVGFLATYFIGDSKFAMKYMQRN